MVNSLRHIHNENCQFFIIPFFKAFFLPSILGSSLTFFLTSSPVILYLIVRIEKFLFHFNNMLRVENAVWYHENLLAGVGSLGATLLNANVHYLNNKILNLNFIPSQTNSIREIKVNSAVNCCLHKEQAKLYIKPRRFVCN